MWRHWIWKFHFRNLKGNARIILPLLWPSNSADLNPVDLSVWGILQDKVYMHDWSRRPQAPHKNWVGCHCCCCASWRRISQHASRPAAVISSTVFDLDIVFSAITTTFFTVVDQLSTFMQVARPDWFNCSSDFALCTTCRLSNSQGEVVTLIN